VVVGAAAAVDVAMAVVRVVCWGGWTVVEVVVAASAEEEEVVVTGAWVGTGTASPVKAVAVDVAWDELCCKFLAAPE
jgi:hypothetical protein